MASGARKLSDHAAAIFDNLGEDGIALTPSEIVELNELCWNVESPEMRVMLSKGVPVRCGDEWLWPLTLAAHVWYTEVGAKLSTGKHQRLALGYAMAHGYETAAFDRLWTEREAERAVNEWTSRLHVRLQTLDECMSQVLAQDAWPDDKPPKNEEREPPSPGEYSALVAAASGMKPSDVECGMSFRYAQLLFDKARQIANGEGDKISVRYLAAEAAKARYIREIKKRRSDNGE